MSRRTGITYATYRHEDAVYAIDDFADVLDGGRPAFDQALRQFVLELYRGASPANTAYFVDKTPRYHLIADQVMHLFPEAKCIFLWRNPLSVMASMIRTWGSGRWNLFRHRVDLEVGLIHLIETYVAHRKTALSVRYEDLVKDPAAVTERVFRFLELDFRPEVLSTFAEVELEGLMGDRSGPKHGVTINSWSSLNSDVLAGTLRRMWLRRYLLRLGTENLHTMGYELATLLAAVKAMPAHVATIPGDLIRMGYGVAYQSFDELVALRSRRYLRNTGRSSLPDDSCQELPHRGNRDARDA